MVGYKSRAVENRKTFESQENGNLDWGTLSDVGNDLCGLLARELVGRKVCGGKKLVDNRADLIRGFDFLISTDCAGAASREG